MLEEGKKKATIDGFLLFQSFPYLIFSLIIVLILDPLLRLLWFWLYWISGFFNHSCPSNAVFSSILVFSTCPRSLPIFFFSLIDVGSSPFSATSIIVLFLSLINAPLFLFSRFEFSVLSTLSALFFQWVRFFLVFSTYGFLIFQLLRWYSCFSTFLNSNYPPFFFLDLSTLFSRPFLICFVNGWCSFQSTRRTDRCFIDIR